MNWTHFLMAVAAAGVVSSFTDWFFFGVLFHDKYAAYPEVWRAAPGKSETKTILTVTLMGLVTCAAFVFLYHLSSLHGYGAALELAGIVWIMAPVPLTISNALYVKMHPALVVSHSMGWLARLVAAALAAGWLLV
ncbi:MAG TPA: DUF1761 domain-containing protein [Bryobacteraceae bacterium]|nr:DUF1761 domain-containing protein [Bryobacteraceae bacterium]